MRLRWWKRCQHPGISPCADMWCFCPCKKCTEDHLVILKGRLR